MSNTVHDLIGRILNPEVTSQAPVRHPEALVPTESLSVLIGRIITAPGSDRILQVHRVVSTPEPATVAPPEPVARG
jgi:hypothetical protein